MSIASATQWRHRRRSWRHWLIVAMLMACAIAHAAPTPTDAALAQTSTIDARLQHADRIKRTDNAGFQSLLAQLDANAGGMTAVQRDWLDYLHAWQTGYDGNYPQALIRFNALLARTRDPTVRARARISVIDDQINSNHLVDAYANIEALLDGLPTITDHDAHFLVLASASSMYVDAGQFDLAMRYIDAALAFDHGALSTCIMSATKVNALERNGKLGLNEPAIDDGIAACRDVGETIFANIIRVSVANVRLGRGDVEAALASLQPFDAEAMATGSTALIPPFRATLATAMLRHGDLARAGQYARSAIEHAGVGAHSKAIADAWQVLYQIARKQGDDAAALGYLEHSAAAEKSYLNAVSTSALAYQTVAQRVRSKKDQIAALQQQNQLLALKRQAQARSLLAVQLAIALLLLLLGSVALYAVRTRRAQRKFRDLARRDGLTGICNHQHFMERAEQVLAASRKDAREASMVTIDLDHFKRVNDEHGHAAGDAALRHTVDCCKAHLVPNAIFGRLGGEEFAILLPDCVRERAAELAETMRARIAALHDLPARLPFAVTASFGIASTRDVGHDLKVVLAHADRSLYQAKRDGRNRVAVHGAGEPATMMATGNAFDPRDV